jgi:hypothetical protein
VGQTARLAARPSAQRVPAEHRGVVGVLAVRCRRVRFDFEKDEFEWRR